MRSILVLITQNVCLQVSFPSMLSVLEPLKLNACRQFFLSPSHVRWNISTYKNKKIINNLMIKNKIKKKGGLKECCVTTFFISTNRCGSEAVTCMFVGRKKNWSGNRLTSMFAGKKYNFRTRNLKWQQLQHCSSTHKSLNGAHQSPDTRRQNHLSGQLQEH